MKVCLIGFGEVGTILADDFAAKGVTLSAFDVRFADQGSAPTRAVQDRGLPLPPDAARAARDCDLVVSAVTAAQTGIAAKAVAAGMRAGSFYLDLNSASPMAKSEAAQTINDAGGRYVEAAVMSPILPKRAASPLLLGGPFCADFLPIGRDLGFTGAQVYAAEYGKASAAKLCRSVMIKGVEALLAESLTSARHYGVEDVVLQSLQNLLPGADWRELSRYMISRAVEHGARRAEEMREAARTVAEAGLTPLMSAAAAERQDWAAAFKPSLSAPDLGALLDALRRHPEHP